MLGLVTDLLEKAKQGDMRRGREVHQAVVTHTTPKVLKARLRAIGVDAQDEQTIGQIAGASRDRQIDLLAAAFSD